MLKDSREWGLPTRFPMNASEILQQFFSRENFDRLLVSSRPMWEMRISKEEAKKRLLATMKQIRETIDVTDPTILGKNEAVDVFRMLNRSVLQSDWTSPVAAESPARRPIMTRREATEDVERRLDHVLDQRRGPPTPRAVSFEETPGAPLPVDAFEKQLELLQALRGKDVESAPVSDVQRSADVRSSDWRSALEHMFTEANDSLESDTRETAETAAPTELRLTVDAMEARWTDLSEKMTKMIEVLERKERSSQVPAGDERTWVEQVLSGAQRDLGVHAELADCLFGPIPPQSEATGMWLWTEHSLPVVRLGADAMMAPLFHIKHAVGHWSFYVPARPVPLDSLAKPLRVWTMDGAEVPFFQDVVPLERWVHTSEGGGRWRVRMGGATYGMPSTAIYGARLLQVEAQPELPAGTVRVRANGPELDVRLMGADPGTREIRRPGKMQLLGHHPLLVIRTPCEN